MLSQNNRSLGLLTALGEGVLFIERITGQESLGNPFEYSVSAVAENDEFSFDDLIGTDATVRLEMRREGAEETRFFNGIISKISHLGYDQQGNSRYELTLVPWLWFLTQGSDCRIFQQKTVPEILEEVFNIVGVENYDLQLVEQYQPRDYCVQYRETHFNFVQRLMQHEGIYYFWEHKDGEHKMIICDKMSAHASNPGFEEVKYRSSGASADEETYISSWKANQMVTPGVYAHNSFNFKAPIPAPNTKLLGKAEKALPHSQGMHEVYDNPSDFMELSDGERLAAIRREEVQCDAKTISSATNVRGLLVGKLFQPLDVPREDQSGEEFLITSSNFQASVGGFGSGVDVGEEGYSASFTAIPSKQCVFRPRRDAAIPKHQGPQTAFVTGPPGEEVFVDKFGRVKIQFHWDRYGSYDDGSSCWVRVSQATAGVGFGSVDIPRIGQEVIVDFIEGNPDLPIITGRVYNGGNMPNASNAGRDGLEGNTPPTDLIKAAMMTSMKSNSYGGSGGSNEITMNDAAGAEGLFMKAQKDEIHIVGNDREDTVVANEKSSVGTNRDDTVGGDEKLLVVRNRDRTVTKVEKVKVTGDLHETFGAHHFTKTKGPVHHEITKGHLKKIGADSELQVGGMYTEYVTGNFSSLLGSNQYTNVAGDQTTEVDGLLAQKGKRVIIDAGEGLMLKCGDSYIILSSGGVIIQGNRVDINKGMAMPKDAPADPGEFKMTKPTSPKPPAPPKKPRAAGGGSGGSGGAGPEAGSGGASPPSGGSGGSGSSTGGSAAPAPSSPAPGATPVEGVPGSLPTPDLSSIVPVNAIKEAASGVADKAQGLADQAKDIVKEIAQVVKSPIQLDHLIKEVPSIISKATSLVDGIEQASAVLEGNMDLKALASTPLITANLREQVQQIQEVRDSVGELKDKFPKSIDEVVLIKNTLVQDHNKVRDIAKSLEMQSSFLKP